MALFFLSRKPPHGDFCGEGRATPAPWARADHRPALVLGGAE